MERLGEIILPPKFSLAHTQYMRHIEHTRRIRRIMKRKPGTSKTLDNKIPESHCNNARTLNVRYHAMREEFNTKAAIENKALLKRIGKILTAPATINKNNIYQPNKPVMISKHTAREKMLAELKNKTIFDRIHNAPGYYHVKEWEQDYKRQLATQRFVRHVFYRPKRDPKPADINTKEGIIAADDDRNNISTFPTIKSSSASIEERRSTYPKKASTSSHISRMRTIRDKSTSTSASSTMNSNKQYKDVYNIIEQGVGADPAEMLDSDHDDEDEHDLSYDENRKELASVERIVDISYDLSQIPAYQSDGEVSCWLVNQELLLIIATATSAKATISASPSADEPSSNYIQAEADILISDLASIKGHSKEDLLLDNMKLLLSIAKDIVETVTIRIDNNDEARLILRLIPTPPSPPATSNTEPSTSRRKDSLRSPRKASADLVPSKRPDSQLEEKYANLGVSQDDLAKMITDTSTILQISKAVKVPVVLYEDRAAMSPKLVAKRLGRQTLDHVSVIINASINGDEDAVSVRATIIESSKLVYNKQPALMKDTDLYSSIGLPSIAHADAELMIEYLYNLADSCVIHHNISSGDCTLIIPM